jgi:ribosomal protein L37AE/L43A
MERSFRNVVLLCEECGERTVLGGPLSVWRCGSTSFECGCGAQLTLSDQLDPTESEKLSETRATALYR